MITILDIINICNSKYLGKDVNLTCENFSSDTRELKSNDIYIGIKGEKYNGNNFYKEAFEKGAKACILDKDTKIEEAYQNYPILLVDNTIQAIQELAKFKREKYNIPVIAITGSVGKTSVKDMIYRVLTKKYNVLCNIGNHNNHIGVPLTILKLKNQNAMILEMGMNHFGEISKLSKIASPTIGVISTIGTAHIGNLGSRENILKAKLEILDGMKENSPLVINNDNDLLRTVEYKNIISIGIDNKSTYMAKDVKIDAFSSNFNIENNNITIPIGSDAFVRNALLAYAVGKSLNVTEKDIIDGLENIELTPHRLQKIETSKYTIIDDTYNASLDSIKNAAEILSRTDKRKVFIFADILELEEFGKEIHKEIGKIFIDNKINVLLTVGTLSKYTNDVFSTKNENCYHFNNNKELINTIDALLKKDDIILVKGSHSMNLIEIVEYLKRA